MASEDAAEENDPGAINSIKWKNEANVNPISRYVAMPPHM